MGVRGQRQEGQVGIVSADINSVSVSGHVTKDPTLRSTQSGTGILTFSVAVNERRKTQQGEWEDAPSFVDVVVFGKPTEWLSKDIRKGRFVFVQGKLRQTSWEDRETGQRRSKVEIVADLVKYDRLPDAERQQGTYQQPQQGAYQQPQQQAAYQPPQPTRSAYVDQSPAQPQADGLYDDSIPF